jgi:HEAT repeat protein
MRRRGNAAFIFASLGDDRGFDVIKAILEDRSTRRAVEEKDDAGRSAPELQIRDDRYYAVHLFGDLKNARAVPILVPLLKDQDVNWVVPWSLGEIGDKSAIPPLIATLGDNSPDMRVLAIYALEQFDAMEALPQLRALLCSLHAFGIHDIVPAKHCPRSPAANLHNNIFRHTRGVPPLRNPGASEPRRADTAPA